MRNFSSFIPLLIAVFVCGLGHAQTTWTCGFSDSQVPEQLPQNKSLIGQGPICVDIKFHIVRQSNETGGFDPLQIPAVINMLNADFNGHGIFFANVGIDYIDDDIYYDIDANGDTTQLLTMNNVSNAFNFYIVNSSTQYSGSSGGMYTNEFVVVSDAALTSISSHEIGHNFGLYHTHAGSGPHSNNKELITRGPNANCDIAGDLLCDTPADPNLWGKVDSNCNYTGGEQYEGEYYDPDTHNIMSYSPDHCLNHFSEGQGERMRYFIDTKPDLQNILGNTCAVPEIVGDDVICDKTQTTYFLINGGSQNFTWDISPNLIPVSSNSSSITVKPVFNASGSASIIASDFNGYVPEKIITLHNTPTAPNYDIIGGSDNVTYNSVDAFSVPYIPDVSYEWSIVQNTANCNGTQPKINGTASSLITGPYITMAHGTCSGIYRLRCRAFNPCGQFGFLDREINVYDPTTENPCGPLISLSPVPVTNGQLNFRLDYPDIPCDEEMVNAQNVLNIFDTTGNLELSGSYANDTFQIVTRGLVPGIYFAQILDKTNRLQTRSFIIN